MNTRLTLVIIASALLLSGCTRTAQTVSTQNNQSVQSVKPTSTVEPTLNPAATEPAAPVFGTQIKSAHFVRTEPAHAAILDEAPTEIVFIFNFDIDPASTVSVTKDQTEYAVGEPTVGSDRLTLTQSLLALEPGTYRVTYSACWPDKTCHPGQFEFAVR